MTDEKYTAGTCRSCGATDYYVDADAWEDEDDPPRCERIAGDGPTLCGGILDRVERKSKRDPQQSK